MAAKHSNIIHGMSWTKKRPDIVIKGETTYFPLEGLAAYLYCPYFYAVGNGKIRRVSMGKRKTISKVLCTADEALYLTLLPVIIDGLGMLNDNKGFSISEMYCRWRDEYKKGDLYVISDQEELIKRERVYGLLDTFFRNIASLEYKFIVPQERFYYYYPEGQTKYGITGTVFPYGVNHGPSWIVKDCLLFYMPSFYPQLSQANYYYYTPSIFYYLAMRNHLNMAKSKKMRMLFADIKRGSIYVSKDPGSYLHHYGRLHLEKTFKAITNGIMSKYFYKRVGDWCNSCYIQHKCYNVTSFMSEIDAL